MIEIIAEFLNVAEKMDCGVKRYTVITAAGNARRADPRFVRIRIFHKILATPFVMFVSALPLQSPDFADVCGLNGRKKQKKNVVS